MSEVEMKTMNGRIWLVLFLAFCVGLLSGCGTLGNGKVDLPVSPYDAGVYLVTIDQVFKPFASERVQMASDAAFALLAIDYDQPEEMLDDYVRGRIDEIYSDSTPEFRQALFNLYVGAKLRVSRQIDLNPAIPKPDIIEDFKRGVADALKAYKAAG